jgi:hypothetical protein
MRAFSALPPAGSPDRMLFGAGLILVACFVWLVILPGVVAYDNGVLLLFD